MGRQSQVIVERDVLIRAIEREIEQLSPQNLSQCAEMVLGIKLNPLASHKGPRFTAMRKDVHNRHLLNEAETINTDQKAVEIVKQVMFSKPDNVFAASTIALVSAGIHLSRTELEDTLQSAQREGG